MIERCWCGAKSKHLEPLGITICTSAPLHDPTDTGEPKPIEKVRHLYIAGPMSGKPDLNYPAFNHAAKELRYKGYRVTNPVDTGDRAGYRDLLREDLRTLLDCDGVAAIDGWEFSTGARNEVMVAGVLGLHVRSVRDWLAIAGPVKS